VFLVEGLFLDIEGMGQGLKLGVADYADALRPDPSFPELLFGQDRRAFLPDLDSRAGFRRGEWRKC
jgi:hypothetical protein